MTRIMAWSLAITIIVWLASVGCESSDAEALRSLDAAGYSHVTIGNYAWWGCAQGDDGYRHHFTARNPVGKPVKGYVCCGWLKGCTVRF